MSENNGPKVAQHEFHIETDLFVYLILKTKKKSLKTKDPMFGWFSLSLSLRAPCAPHKEIQNERKKNTNNIRLNSTFEKRFIYFHLVVTCLNNNNNNHLSIFICLKSQVRRSYQTNQHKILNAERILVPFSNHSASLKCIQCCSFVKLDFPNKSVIFIVSLYFDSFCFLFSFIIIIIVWNMRLHTSTCDMRHIYLSLYVKMCRKWIVWMCGMFVSIFNIRCLLMMWSHNSNKKKFAFISLSEWKKNIYSVFFIRFWRCIDDKCWQNHLHCNP